MTNVEAYYLNEDGSLWNNGDQLIGDVGMLPAEARGIDGDRPHPL